MPKIKIAFLTPKMIIGGAESYIIAKSEWLINNGFEVMVISQGGENVINLPKGVSHVLFDNIHKSPLSFDKEKYTIFIQKLSSLLVKNGVDVVEAHNTFPAVHMALSFNVTGIPFFVNILNELAYDRNPLLAILTRKLNSFGLYYTLTSEMNTYIEKATYSKLKPKLLPIPVKGILANEDKTPFPYILSVCRLSEDKRYVKYLIEDFYELYINNSNAKNYKLIIVGEGTLYEETKTLANHLNNKIQRPVIELKGTVIGDDLSSLYNNCAAFVGMGTTLLLAASCGKPSITCGFSNDSESFAWGYWGENILDKNIIAGGPNSDRKQTSFKEAIQVLIESKERSLSSGKAAKEMFDANYNFDIIMNNWQSEYYKTIECFADNREELKQTLKLNFQINSLRILRMVYKFILKIKK
jgi:glycosyltransferase involved in cell wall biosynthesis